ncbi:MAG: hypothetical protein GQF41_3929 [Candidatus Rifleibacterium amylolyticum]|nr:MAG: hypothetical protein GQF41_3929 [Candidatus Rifleibacterium amylolyticum]
MSVKIFEIIENELERISKSYVYCHCSIQGLGLAIGELTSLLTLLLKKLDGKTLIVPSFCFANNSEYANLLSSGIDYYPERSPARVNIFGEVMRRYAETIRSSHPIYPVLAYGPQAKELVDGDHKELEFLGPRSAIGKLSSKDVHILGLGVSISTNSFFHFVDMPFENLFPIARSAKVHCRVMKNNGSLIYEADYHTISAELRKRIRPDTLHLLMEKESFYRFSDIGQPNFYHLELQPFLSFGKSVAADYYRQGKLPCWWTK